MVLIYLSGKIGVFIQLNLGGFMTSLVNKPLTRAEKYQDDSAWLSTLPLIDESWGLMSQLLKSVNDKFPLVDVLAKRKKYESAKEKTQRKGRPYHQLGDLVKGVILTEDLQQTITVSNFLINHFNVVKWEVKVGNSDNPYCGVIHIDVQLGALTCEIQVMPKKTAEVKKKSNHFYKTGRPSEVAGLWSTVENFSLPQRALLGV